MEVSEKRTRLFPAGKAKVVEGSWCIAVGNVREHRVKILEEESR
jgi:hypothetical protein